MSKSKLTHIEKDILIKELELNLIKLDNMYGEQVTQYTKHILDNTEFVTKQHELIEILNNQNRGMKAVNWLVTALLGISIGINIYIVWM